jgi:DNA-binding response OmpR family regulator
MLVVNIARTVLIADDDADIRSILESAVGALGYRIVTAGDGAAAIERCRAEMPDLAILDITMPQMSGTEVCRELKGLPEGIYVPVLFLTARDGVQEKVDALDGGGDDYLTKPFHYQELQARIRALMRVRELNLRLREKNHELEAVQAKLVAQERQLVAHQLAGTAAHKLGQPLSAIMLNCRLMEVLPPGDERSVKALQAIKVDSRRMVEMIEKLKQVDAGRTEAYHENTKILDIEE